MMDKIIDKDKIKVGDVLIMDGQSYISLRMYKELQHQLHLVQETSEYFLGKLTAIEVANENRAGMKIIRMNSL